MPFTKKRIVILSNLAFPTTRLKPMVFTERVRKQVFEMNRAAEYDKYAAQIILSDIEGRAEAARIERTFIDDYFLQNGRNPYGNLIPKRKL
jgi:hypothetical protein